MINNRDYEIRRINERTIFKRELYLCLRADNNLSIFRWNFRSFERNQATINFVNRYLYNEVGKYYSTINM